MKLENFEMHLFTHENFILNWKKNIRIMDIISEYAMEK